VRHWYRRGALAWLLWPASLAFGLLVFIRRMLFRLRVLRSSHPGIPVVIVGNITVGGSGKTPLVLWIAEFLKAHGWSPAIVSRGYGGAGGAPRAATVASTPDEVGDEPVVLARRSGCPVWIGANRVKAVEALRRQHPEVDVVVLDDGLQHYRLRRDLEIAVLDSRGLGNGWLLPAGPLREPPRRLRAVHAVVSHQAPALGAGNLKTFEMRLEGEVAHRMSDARDRQPLQAWRGRTVHAVAGIGNPSRFFLHVGKLGPKVVPHPFPDHHRFGAEDLEFGDSAPVLMTEKDAVKLRGHARADWWVLPVTAQLDPAFGEWLLRTLDGRRRPKAA
jgi:tetraacyldisaccharide 4'-kinase